MARINTDMKANFKSCFLPQHPCPSVVSVVKRKGRANFPNQRLEVYPPPLACKVQNMSSPLPPSVGAKKMFDPGFRGRFGQQGGRGS
jgi:hypothetical protein